MSQTKVALPAHLELYRNFLQENGTGIRGIALKARLQDFDRLEDCVRFEDKEVQGWINNFASYPDELKGKKVLLLTSNSIGTQDCATSLEWAGNRVEEVRVWLQDIFNGDSYVLLRII